MQFLSRIDVFLPNDIVERTPTTWDRLRTLWGEVDLRTDRVRDKIEAATFVYELRKVFDAVGIRNARSLVVDGATVFHDADARDDDLPDLMLALADHAALFGESCRELRLSVEHEEAGMHLVFDATVTSEHRRESPSARLTVMARILELVSRPGESAQDYRDRIEPFLHDPKRPQAARFQFGAVVARLETELLRVFTDTRVVVSIETIDAAALMRVDLPAERAEQGAPKSIEETAAPQRNFTLSADRRIAALVSGPPAYAVRLRRIEDLEAQLGRALYEARRAGGRDIPIAVVRGLEEINRLIEEHNRYYPIESNMPMDLATGQLMDLGKPWRPRPAATIDGLLRHFVQAKTCP